MKTDLLNADLLKTDLLKADLLKTDLLKAALLKAALLEADLLKTDLLKAALLKAALLEALKQIHKQPMPRFGICHQLSLACDDASESYWRNKIQSLTYRWPKFSGIIDYPVPHPTESPCVAYNTTQNMWDRRTEYGQARWDLLEFCISELEKELNDE